jgi:hypothetical protein
MMRRLNVTLSVNPHVILSKWRANIKRICLAGRIWDRVRKAELAGAEVKFTVQVLGDSEHGPDWVNTRLLPGILPARYAYKVNIV